MATRKLSIPLVAVLVVSILAACSEMNTGGTPTPVPQTSAPVVEDNTVSASGEVVPKKWVSLSFSSGGQIVKIQVEPGQQVDQDKLLASVDDLPAISARDAASAQLASASAQLASASAQLASTKATLERLKDLEAADRDIASAEAAVSAAEAAVTAAKETISAAEANLNLANQAFDNTKLFSPFSGIIVEVNGHDGEILSPGQPLIVMADFSTLQVETTDMSEVDVARVHVNDTADISFDALPNISVTGKVVQIALKKSAGSGVYYTVTIAIDTIPENLRWGMSAFAVIKVK
jgi:HlyD family secretion protein